MESEASFDISKTHDETIKTKESLKRKSVYSFFQALTSIQYGPKEKYI